MINLLRRPICVCSLLITCVRLLIATCVRVIFFFLVGCCVLELSVFRDPRLICIWLVRCLFAAPSVLSWNDACRSTWRCDFFREEKLRGKLRKNLSADFRSSSWDVSISIFSRFLSTFLSTFFSVANQIERKVERSVEKKVEQINECRYWIESLVWWCWGVGRLADCLTTADLFDCFANFEVMNSFIPDWIQF